MMEEQCKDSADRHNCSMALPVLLLVISFLITVGFQTYALVKDRGAVNLVLANQRPVIEQAQKMRTQLDSIARRTALLAEQGNPNARALVEELKKAGITINTNVPQTK